MPDETPPVVGNPSSQTSPSPTPPVPQTADGKYVLKDGDKETPVDIQQLYTLASKASGADARFAEAAKIRQEQAELRENLVRTDQGDLDAYAKVLSAAGYSQAVIEQRLSAAREAEEEPTVTEQAKPVETVAQMAALPKPLQEAVDGLGADRVAALLGKMDTADRDAVRTRIVDETWEDVAKEGAVGTIVSGGGSKAAKLRKLSDQLIASRIRGGEKYGELLRSAVARDVAEYAAEMSPVGNASTTPSPGLGLAPSISLAASQAQKVEMPSIGDADFTDKLTARMLQLSFQK